MRQKLKKHVSDFMKCGLMGWGMECFWTGCGSLYEKKDRQMHCMTSLWMFPIYGMAAFLAPVCRLLKNRSLLFRGLTYTGLIFTGEFLTGMWLNRRELCPWNYERSRWNLAKVIRLDFAPCWFVTGLLFERLLRENDPSLRPD